MNELNLKMLLLIEDRGSEAVALVSLQPNFSSVLTPARFDPG